jgi:hypothetical protein
MKTFLVELDVAVRRTYRVHAPSEEIARERYALLGDVIDDDELEETISCVIEEHEAEGSVTAS